MIVWFSQTPNSASSLLNKKVNIFASQTITPASSPGVKVLESQIPSPQFDDLKPSGANKLVLKQSSKTSPVQVKRYVLCDLTLLCKPKHRGSVVPSLSFSDEFLTRKVTGRQYRHSTSFPLHGRVKGNFVHHWSRCRTASNCSEV